MFLKDAMKVENTKEKIKKGLETKVMEPYK